MLLLTINRRGPRNDVVSAIELTEEMIAAAQAETTSTAPSAAIRLLLETEEAKYPEGFYASINYHTETDEDRRWMAVLNRLPTMGKGAA